jgi:hypothetical protein
MSDQPRIQRGEDAGLSMVRAAAADATLASTALSQVLEAEEHILLDPLSVKASLISDDDEDSKDPVVGSLVITSERLLFWADESSEHDLGVPSIYIDLHAMAQDPVSVYIQISNDEDSLELTLVLPTTSNQENEDCQAIFAALSQLVSLHPIDPNEETNDQMEEEEGMMFYEPPPPTTDNGTNEEEREAMLAHLDRLLIVPPELEQPASDHSGQFDDAEDDDDIL